MEPHQEIYNYLSPFLTGLLLSTGIGLIIGLEREFNKFQQNSTAGIRTFPIVSILGFLLASLPADYGKWSVVVALPALILLLGLDHFNKTPSKPGHTTHLALVSTFVLGVMVALHLYKEALASAVIIVTLLALKETFTSTLKRITHTELLSIIKFFILALLILPFLPSRDFGPGNILNAYTIGWVVVIVSLLNFAGYFLVKFIGTGKGIFLTALLGGLISSTAVAWSFAPKGKENPGLAGSYASGIVISSSIMFPRLALLAFIFNPALLTYLWLPFSLMFGTAIFFSWRLWRKKKKPETEQEIKIGNPLNILSALSFGALFVGILLTVYYAGIYLGDKGLYLSAIISGLADTDAITISMTELGGQSISAATAAMVVVTATLSNTLVKMGISIWKGGREVGRKVGTAFGSVLLVGILYVLINQILN
ncbi:MAG TPA: MgtC/SapB family protein [Cryomorphaceae bacterium]|nr:MgtC/SapB family protein [Cryomorphaceae bacterium]